MKNKIYSGKVLVLGTDTRSFLTVIRSLGRKKIDVHVAWCNPEAIALYSRYIKKIHHIPSYTAENSQWLLSFIEILKVENYDLVIPCNDPSIIPLQNHRKELEKYSLIYLLDDDVFNVCIDKSETTKLAKSLKIPVPKDIITSDINEIIQFSNKYSYPIVIKPLSSFTKQKIGTRLEVKKAHNKDELISLSSRMLKNGSVQIQENFTGKGVGVEILAKNGTVLTTFQHERVHEPMMGGGSSYRKGVSLNEDLCDAVDKLIRQLNYTGVAMIEFKVNKELNKWVLIEINARFWGSLPLSVASGIDFPYWLYQMLTSSKSTFPKQYKKLYCRNTALDYEWLIANLGADRNDPLLASIPFHQVALEIFNILLFKERNDTLQLDDVKPSIMELIKIGGRIFNSINSRLVSFIKNTYLYKKYTYYKCRKIFMKSRNIMFLCYGNICRSPFAELYAHNVFPENFTIVSCGMHEKINRSSPDEAIDSALNFNVNLLNHHSIQVSESIVKKADIIFVFDEIHFSQLLKKYPFVKKYTVMITSLNMDLPRIINDPFGGEVENFTVTYLMIKNAIDSMRKLIN